ncbi:MAG TPA: hypothetical protein H9867_01600 [Candidatus Corynebacterium gallistercoris]|uniref:Secreted protein n=1 Tax=Candidatus Corynebacterium gallistercoris TaxID=2838530 RepID=A0A9D1UPT4_9CORY|nr:hypothetical protein [Candidatus Corynebacterium gallistercoris]
MTKPAVSRKVRRLVAAVIAAVTLTAVGVAGTARAQLPELPPVPPLPEMEDILPPELKDKRIEVPGIGGLDFAPPAPLEGITLPLQQYVHGEV